MTNLSRRFPLFLGLLFSFSFLFSGCQAIADIFKAGVWVGVILVIIVLALIFGIMRMFK